MMYQARTDGHEWWVYNAERDVFITALTQAEAEIIAFALNTVARGWFLVATPDEPTDRDADYYTGPTKSDR